MTAWKWVEVRTSLPTKALEHNPSMANFSNSKDFKNKNDEGTGGAPSCMVANQSPLTSPSNPLANFSISK